MTSKCSKLKWNHELRVSGLTAKFWTFHSFVRTLIFPLKFFFENCTVLRRKTNCATIRSFLVATLVKLSSWPISAWKLTQFMVKCYIFPFYSLYSLFLVLWVFCFLHCLMVPVQHTCQCMSSLVYLFLHLLLEPFSWESMKNFSSPSKSPSSFLLNLLFNLHSCTGAKLNVAWENSHHLAMLPLVSPPNDVWETSAEIPYWWCVITQIWVETRHQYGISALISQTSFGGENSDSLGDRRAASCESFMRTLRPSNPVFGLAMSGRVTTVHSYSLRSCWNYNNKMCKTKRLSEFVSVKYLDFLS